MTKRIVSGVFLLIALGALGLILAGALTSGEQLIVRFLTAIIVAALGLYVISDLRLQADDHAVAAGSRTTMSSPRVTTGEQPPPNSTAAFMATVTGKRSSTTADLDASGWDGLPDDLPPGDVVGEAGLERRPEPTIELPQRIGTGKQTAGVPGNESSVEVAVETAGAETGVFGRADGGVEAAILSAPTAEADDDEVSPYSSPIDEASMWPFTDEASALTSTYDADDDIDGLVAIFAKKTEQEISEREAVMSMAGPASLSPPGYEPMAPTNGRVGDFLHQGVPLNGGGDGIDRAHADEGVDIEKDRSASGGNETESGNSTEWPTSITGAATTNSAGNGSFQPDATAGNGAATNSDESSTDESLPEDEEVRESEPLIEPVGQLQAASYAEEPIAPIIDLRLPQATSTSDDVEAAIRSGEVEVISSLIDQGVLSTDGPISDRDVRTMVYVAFTSSELRKILLAGGTIDGDNSNLDLGDVEVFPEVLSDGPKPKALGPGTPTGVDVGDGYHPDSQAL